MKKLNLAGGEPLIVDRGHYAGEIFRYCKEELDLESTSIITNGSKMTSEWLD